MFIAYRIVEEPEQESTWNKFNHNAGSRVREPQAQFPNTRYAQFDQMSRTQELPQGQMDLLRASVESLPNFPTRQNGPEPDSRSNPSVHGSCDHLDSDYHSNAEDNQNIEFHGHVYPLPSDQGQSHPGANQGHGRNLGFTEDHQKHHQSNMVERESILRKSIEDFAKFKEVYQSQEHFLGHHASVGHKSDIQGHQGHQHYHAAEHPYDQNYEGEGHYYHHHDQGQPIHHHGYEGHYPDAHHHFRNIYQDRPYHTIGERGETEGGNAHAGENMHYYYDYNGIHADHGFQGNQMLAQGQDHGFNSHIHDKPDHVKNHHLKGGNMNNQSTSGNGRKLPQVTYRFQSISNEAKDTQRTEIARRKDKENMSLKENTEEYSDNHKVRYEKEHERKREEISKRDKEEKSEKSMEREFMEQGKVYTLLC